MLEKPEVKAMQPVTTDSGPQLAIEHLERRVVIIRRAPWQMQNSSGTERRLQQNQCFLGTNVSHSVNCLS